VSRKTKPPILSSGPIYPIGTLVRVIRPNVLWAGLFGTVIKHTPEKLHRVRLISYEGAEFDAEIPGAQLEYEI